jgi:CRISPR/Cas system CSM-associated protein Csm3 (group 7 of RAMP superfamily)
VFDGDDETGHIELLRQGLGLLADDAIGGQSSRGYGQVKISLERLARVAVESYRDLPKLIEQRTHNLLSGAVEIFGGRLVEVERAA